MIRFFGRLGHDPGHLTPFLRSPPIARVPDLSTQDATTLANLDDQLRPLSDDENIFLLEVLANCEATFPKTIAMRLPRLSFTSRAPCSGEEIRLVFDGAHAVVAVGCGARPHIHARIADLAPFLNVAAGQVTHAGELAACFRDRGAAGEIAFSGGRGALLVPDPSFWRSRAYRSERAWYRASLPWQERRDKILWRGATTGEPQSDWRNLPRAKLCLRTHDAPAELGFDVGSPTLFSCQMPLPRR